MDITIKCQLSLSKKLRALIQEGETRVTLVSQSITDGRGEASLTISSDKSINKNLGDFLGKETSIILVPMELVDVSVNNDTVSSIFSKNARTKPTRPSQPRQPVERLAAIEIDDDGDMDDDDAHLIKTQEEIEEETPAQFKVTKTPAYKKYISSIESLDEAVKAARNKVSDIDPDQYEDKRKRAEAMELKEKSEAIDVDAFIVNDKCANLAINDLGINLVLNSPYNLANISAKRLMGSRDLKSMFNAKLVKFIKPEEIPLYLRRAEQILEKPTLDVYSSPEEAEEHMERSGMNVERMDIGGDDLMRPTESESMLTNLTARPAPKMGGVVKTTHGNAASRTNRSISQDQQENSKGLKTIRRTGLSY